METLILNDLIQGLNPAQSLAVTHSYDKNTLVIAGAGSGKTAVITRRVAFIIGNGHSTDSILAVTFTNKAADEMRSRVAQYIGKENARKILMGTFHSICVELLRQFGREIGVARYFTIYDSGDAKQIMKEVVLEIIGSSDKVVISNCVSKISNMKNSLVTCQEANLRAVCQDDRLIAMAYERYQQKLTNNKALDFDDLIMKTVLLLRASTTARSYCNNRFRFVMGDEVQDTNDAQYELLELIAGKNNIFLVGDDSQSVYGWRGANIDNILKFKERYPDCKIIKLEQNYRSTQTIVNAGNALVKHNTKRLEKTCFSSKAVGVPIKVFKAHNDIKESDFIVKEIINLVTYTGMKYSDVAVLYRVNKLTRTLEDQLMKYGVPYEVVSGVSFYQRKEIKDTVAIMKSVVNPTDNIAFERLLKITPRIGDTMIGNLKETASLENISLSEAVVKYNGRSKASLDNLQKLLKSLTTFAKAPVSEFLKKALDITGYLNRLRAVNTDENKTRIENVEELINVAFEFEKLNNSKGGTDSVTSFLDRVCLSSDTDQLKNPEKVKLMTIHASKGLEFDTVFVMAVEENLLPHKNSQSDDEIEEERRLLYVAITRAERLLYISHSASRCQFGKVEQAMPSRFLAEIPTSLKMEIW